MELAWLETFLAVVDRGGFTAASAHIHRSQSRVSAHIAALEKGLGVLLIDRAHRRVILTPAGLVFAGHARRVIAEVGAAQAAIEAFKSPEQRTVVVFSTPSMGAACPPDLIPTLDARLPAHPPHDERSRFTKDDPEQVAPVPGCCPAGEDRVPAASRV